MVRSIQHVYCIFTILYLHVTMWDGLLRLYHIRIAVVGVFRGGPLKSERRGVGRDVIHLDQAGASLYFKCSHPSEELLYVELWIWLAQSQLRKFRNPKNKSKSKQFDNLGSFKFNYLIYVWGEGLLAKAEGSLAAPLLNWWLLYLYEVKIELIVLA